MAKPRKAWAFNPGKKPKTALPGTLKDEVDTKARELIETVLNPKHDEVDTKENLLAYLRKAGAPDDAVGDNGVHRICLTPT